MVEELDSLNKEIATLKNDKFELETSLDDLKRTLKLTESEKESQVITFDLIYSIAYEFFCELYFIECLSFIFFF